MEKIYVLDTNAYRNLVHNHTSKEMYKRKLHGCICFSVITAIELLRHLKLEDNAYSDCKKALCLLVDNTTNDENGSINFKVSLPDMFYLLSCYFSHPKDEDKIGQYVVSISYNMTKGDLDSDKSLAISEIDKHYYFLIKTMIDNFQNYLDIMFQKENTSWDSIFKDDKKRKDFYENLNSGRFHEYIAEALIRSVVEESEKENIANIEIFNKFQLDFSASIDFFVQKILRLLIASSEAANKLSESDRKNKKPKWNSFFDMQLMAGVEYLNSKGDNAILVTNEQDIIKTFKKVGKSKLAITLEEYIIE